jgi:hypothetical protein
MLTQMIKSIISIIYSTLIIVGVILLLITLGTITSSSIVGSMVGYSLIGGGVLLLISNLIYKLLNNKHSNIFSYIYTVGPFLILLGIVIYSLYLIITYNSSIVNGNVSSGYVKFTNISIILILLQLYLFFVGTKNENEIIDKKSSMLLYLIGIINIIIMITLGIILASFTTDG